MDDPPRLLPDVLPTLLNDYEVMPDTPVMTIPGTEPISLPSDAAYGDQICYSDILSDDLFDYRTVELPIALAQLIPRRNFSESEWRSIGVCMSAGWENYDRRPCELHVLWFRRPRPGVTRKELQKKWLEEIAAEKLQIDNDEFFARLEKVFVFPMFAFDLPRGLRRFTAVANVTRSFHAAVLQEAERFISIPELRFQPSGG